jgi:hypothetical protein
MVTVRSMPITTRRDIIVIGGSAGAFEAMKTLVSELPLDMEAAIFVVLHSSPTAPSRLAQILQGCTTLSVRQAEDGDRIEHRTVVVARPDYHLLLEGEKIRITRGPRENRHRLAVDALFRSAAYSHSARVIAVVLSGALDDGTAGLWAVRDRDGVAIVQDPEEAPVPSMPLSALRYAGADHVVRIAQMGSLFERLTLQAIEAEGQTFLDGAGGRDPDLQGGARAAGRRDEPRRNHPLHLPRVPRRPGGAETGRGASLSLPHRTRLLAQQLAGGGHGVRRGLALGRAPVDRGELDVARTPHDSLSIGES